MRRPGVPTVAGILLFAVGMALVIDAGAVGGGVGAEVADYVGALAVLAALLVARLSMTADRSNPEPPTVETKADLPVPGEEVDDLLARIDADPLGRIEDQDELRRRLTAIAVTLFADRYGFREAAARAALDGGAWTDDPHAAAFFVGQYPEWAPLWLQLRDRATFTRTPPSMQAAHVATELLALTNGERPGIDEKMAAGSEDGVGPDDGMGGGTGTEAKAEREAVTDAKTETGAEEEPEAGSG